MHIRREGTRDVHREYDVTARNRDSAAAAHDVARPAVWLRWPSHSPGKLAPLPPFVSLRTLPPAQFRTRYLCSSSPSGARYTGSCACTFGFIADEKGETRVGRINPHYRIAAFTRQNTCMLGTSAAGTCE